MVDDNDLGGMRLGSAGLSAARISPSSISGSTAVSKPFPTSHSRRCLYELDIGVPELCRSKLRTEHSLAVFFFWGVFLPPTPDCLI